MEPDKTDVGKTDTAAPEVTGKEPEDVTTVSGLEARPPASTEQSPPRIKSEAAYAVFISLLQKPLAKGDWDHCRNSFRNAAGDPELKPFGERIKRDEVCMALLEKAYGAMTDGARKLNDQPVVLETTSKTEKLQFGKGGDCRFLKIHEDRIRIERKAGNGSLEFDYSVSDFTAESRAKLMVLGLPDDGEAKLALALYRYVTSGDTTGETSETATSLDEAMDAGAPAELVRHIRTWQALGRKERAAERFLADVVAPKAGDKKQSVEKQLEILAQRWSDTAAYAYYLDHGLDGIKEKLASSHVQQAGSANPAGSTPPKPKPDAHSVFVPNANGLIVFEAEHYQRNQPGPCGTRWQLDRSGKHSGEGMMAALPNASVRIDVKNAKYSPRLDYKVMLEKGTYYVWVSGDCPDDKSDSIFVGLNLGIWNMNKGNGTALARKKHGWQRIPEEMKVLRKGSNVINIWIREDGVRIDKIILTRNKGFKPSDLGPKETVGK